MAGFVNAFTGRWVPSESTKSYTISNYCTNFAMTDTSRIDLRTSKRKRARVSYYEEPVSDEDELDISDEEERKDAKKCSRTKKRKTASSKPRPEQKVFPFLELPGELRNKIYMYCLHDPAGIYLESTTKKLRRTVYRETECTYKNIPDLPASEDDDEDEDKEERPSDSMRRLTPALLAVCKQINTEACDILYDHTFHVKNTVVLHSFLVDLGPRGAAYLKSVELAEWEWSRGRKTYNHACFTALANATNIEKFTYHSIRSRNDDPKSAAAIFYRDAFPWLEAVGVAKGKADAAVDLVDVIIPENSLYSCSDEFEPYEEIARFRVELAQLLRERVEYLRS